MAMKSDLPGRPGTSRKDSLTLRHTEPSKGEFSSFSKVTTGETAIIKLCPGQNTPSKSESHRSSGVKKKVLSYDIRKFFPRKKPEDRVKKHQSEGSDECPGMGTEEEEEEKKKITKLKPRITKEGLVLFEEDKSLSRMCKDGDYLECGTKEKTVSCVKDVSLSELDVNLHHQTTGTMDRPPEDEKVGHYHHASLSMFH